jgi:hypothetical protein
VDDFGRTMAIVMGVGAAIAAVGTLLLFLMFRAFGEARQNARKPIVLMVILITFVALSIGAILYFT